MSAINVQGLWYKYAGLVVVLAGYLMLASAYSTAIPFSKGPDEYINYQYILFIARHHRLPVEGAYPTSLWDAGEIINDEISVPLDGLPRGRYTVVVGLYDLATGQRLAVPGSADNGLQLTEFMIP